MRAEYVYLRSRASGFVPVLHDILLAHVQVVAQQRLISVSVTSDALRQVAAGGDVARLHRLSKGSVFTCFCRLYILVVVADVPEARALM